MISISIVYPMLFIYPIYPGCLSGLLYARPGRLGGICTLLTQAEHLAGALHSYISRLLLTIIFPSLSSTTYSFKKKFKYSQDGHSRNKALHQR